MKLPPNPLSKSRYLSGLQCVKRIYLEVHRRDLLPQKETPPAVRALLDAGAAVGRLARTRHRGGVLIDSDHFHHHAAVTATREAMADPTVPAVFEGAFTHDRVKIRVDILIRGVRDLWHLHEVKSVTGLKTSHVPDLAVQVHVLRGAGVKVARAGILHLNREYVLGPEGLDVGRLFNLSTPVQGIALDVLLAKVTIPKLLAALEADEVPDVTPGDHCHAPQQCPFTYLCCPPRGQYDLAQIPRAKKLLPKLAAMGIDDIRHVPRGMKLAPTHRRVVDAVATGREQVSPGLRPALTRVGYPLGFLDFEAFAPAIPKYVGTKPFQALVTQWSLHRQYSDGRLDHAEFLHDAESDPREAFATSLLAALEGDDGVIFVYSSYEATQIKGLAIHFPLLAERLSALLPRIVDLLVVLQRYYYHPDFGGSFGIKTVLPVLVPGLAYDDLRLSDGLAAAAEYARMISSDTPPQERREIREALLRYCERDSLALVRVREALLARSYPGSAP